MYELRQLRTFQAVAARQSVTRAAAALGYAQSSVTAQIQALEEDVGVPLFDRIGRRVELTKAGQAMVSYADRILALANEARAVVGNDRKPSGALTIGASETLLTHRLPDVIGKFQKTHPQVEISVIAAENCEIEAGQLKLNSSIDIAFILDRQHKSGSLIVECLSAEDVLVLVSPGHRLASVNRLNADMLTDEQVLLTERSCGYRVLSNELSQRQALLLTRPLRFPASKRSRDVPQREWASPCCPGLLWRKNWRSINWSSCPGPKNRFVFIRRWSDTRRSGNRLRMWHSGSLLNTC